MCRVRAKILVARKLGREQKRERTGTLATQARRNRRNRKILAIYPNLNIKANREQTKLT